MFLFVTQPAWDAFFLGLASMRVVCQYALEPPTDPSAADPSWSPTASAVLRSSISGLMRLVSDNTRGTNRDIIRTLSFKEVKDRSGGDAQSKHTPGSEAPWRAPEAPEPPKLPSKVLQDMFQPAGQRESLVKGSPPSSPLLSVGETGEEREARYTATGPTVQKLLSDTASEGKGLLRGWDVGHEGERATTADAEDLGESHRKETFEALREKLPGVSFELLFEEAPPKSPTILLAGISFAASPEKEEQKPSSPKQEEAPQEAAKDESKERGGAKGASKERAGGEPKPEADEAAKPEHEKSPSPASPHSSPEEQGRKPGPLEKEENASPEKGEASRNGPEREHSRDREAPRNEEGSPLLQQEPRYAPEPGMHGEAMTTSDMRERSDSKGLGTEHGGEEGGPAGGTEQEPNGSPSSKLSLRALRLLSLQSHLLQMASGNSDWGGIEIYGALAPLPEAPVEGESGELREDVLFYEAEGHYTDTGEEYCLPLGEQQQLVKLLTSNTISVRAKKRKFSFIFAPTIGETPR